MHPEWVNGKDSKFDFIQADLSAELGGLTSYSVGLFSGKRCQAFKCFILFGNRESSCIRDARQTWH